MNKITGLLLALVAIPRAADAQSLWAPGREILHGTLFGALYSLGLTEPGPPVSDLQAFVNGIRARLAMVLLAALLAHRALVQCMDWRFGLSDANTTSEAALRGVAKLAWFRGKE